jgi:predicted lipoprotein with Yx(FWY)xxD motif
MIRGRSVRCVFSGTAVLALLALSLAACGSSGNNASASTTATSAPTATTIAPQGTLRVANSGLGSILVNAQGRTLYMFSADSATTSACTGACATPWPPLATNGTPTAGTGANGSLLGTIKRSDGTSQVTYNRHPLYTFFKDQKAGDTNGQGVMAFGGTWSVVSPASSATTPTPPTTTKPQPAPPPPPPPPTTAAPANPGIPQNGGGDGDADNNGGPNDGDGGV